MAVDVQELQYRLRGIDELSKPAKKAEDSLKRLGNQAKRSQTQMNQFGGSLVGAQKNLRKFALGGLQQAGYQIGDYAVQVANGTSATQAFGQQAGQFLQIFGPVGAVLGAAVSVWSAYKIATDKAKEASESASTGLMSLSEALKQVKEGTQSANLEMELLARGFKSAEEAALSNAIATQKTVVAQKELSLANARGIAKVGAETALNNAKEQLKLLEQQLEGYREASSAMGNALNINKQMLDVELAHARIAGQLVEYAKNTQAAYAEYYQSRIAAAQMADREEQKILQQSHANQLKVMGETQETAIRYVNNLKQAYVQYYNLRIRGEALAAPMSGLKGGRSAGRGGPTSQELQRNDPRVQLAYAQMEIEDKAYKNSISNASNLAKIIKQELSPELVRAQRLGESVGQSFENAMMSAVDGTMSLGDAFRSMASDIIKEIYRVFVVKRITGFITDAASMASLPTGQSHTGTMGLPSFAGGGYTGGGARAGGLDGKGGYMAMLHPRETVVDHTKGQGGGAVIVNQTINVSTGVQQTVRTEIKSLMPQIAESAKAAVVDAKRRGGSYGRAFA